MNTGSKYEVETGSATAGVRGTQFLVEVDKNNESYVTVYEGNVYLTNFDNTFETVIGKDEKIKVDRAGKFGEKQKHEEKPPVRLKREEANSKEKIEDKKEELKKPEAEWVKEKIDVKEEKIKEDIKEKEDIKIVIENESLKPQEELIFSDVPEVNDRARLILNID